MTLSPTASADEIGEDGAAFAVLRLPRTVLLGAGQRFAIGDVVNGLGRHVLICTDSRLAESSVLADVLTSLRSAGVNTSVFSETPPELPTAAIEDCVSKWAGRDVDVVVGLGGGSCLDLAKLVALLLTHGGTLVDYYGEHQVPGPTIPVVAIPSTSGTGSEATPVAVVSDPDRAMKVGISSPYLIPHTAICDPDLTISCPPALICATGADALSHLVEAFTAVRRRPSARLSRERVFVGKSALTDVACLQGLQLMGRSLLAHHADPAHAPARRDVMSAALAGGIALGTAGTAAAHALQYPVGAMTHTSHGVGVGTLLPYVMRFNLPTRVPEFAAIGRALGAVDATSPDDIDAAEAGVLAVDALLSGLGVPATLSDLGLSRSQVGEVAERSLQASRLVENNPRALDGEAMRTIVLAAYAGDRNMPGFTP